MTDTTLARRTLVPRLLLAGISVLAVIGVTLAPRQLVAPARSAFMDLAHMVSASLLASLTHVQVEGALNLILFVPLGATLALLLPRGLWPLTPVFVFVVSFAIENGQALIPGRVPDGQDIIWNTVGGIVGAFVAGVIREVHRRVRRAAEADQRSK
ncbi:VanZ family protein [Microbacterium algeriense]|uniref:VanZ family protein n=1 Tax=Microbacterium algeriense TaxID=2615184 RepID=UPI0022E6B042|nr:VanZ family protein [Microbacterium algeriense]